MGTEASTRTLHLGCYLARWTATSNQRSKVEPCGVPLGLTNHESTDERALQPLSGLRLWSSVSTAPIFHS